MDAKAFLFQAVDCDKNGRILQAQYLYQEGITLLMNMLEGETNTAKRKAFFERVKEYLDRAEQIKSRITNQLTGGKIEKHIAIEDDDTGKSYSTLFGKYFNENVLEALVEEPYLTEKYQFQNLVIFLELMKKNCKNLQYVRVVTKACPKNPQNQATVFDQMKTDLGNYGVFLHVAYEESLHDRKITLNNKSRKGYIIKIGRGLHFYKPSIPLFSLGLCDYDYRKCRQTDVDIMRTNH